MSVDGKVEAFLKAGGLSSDDLKLFAELFTANGIISVDDVKRLSKEDLTELKVAIGPRNRLLEAIEHAKKPAGSKPPAPAPALKPSDTWTCPACTYAGVRNRHCTSRPECGVASFHRLQSFCAQSTDMPCAVLCLCVCLCGAVRCGGVQNAKALNSCSICSAPNPNAPTMPAIAVVLPPQPEREPSFELGCDEPNPRDGVD
jgi:hypothetical protein